MEAVANARQVALSFDAFVAERLPVLLGVARAITGDRFLAEEITQDVLVKCHRHWDRISTLANPVAYANRMLVNEHLSWRRKWGRVVPVADARVESSGGDHADQHAERDLLGRALSTLPRKQRVVLALRYYAGLADAEIAQTLSCAPSTVRADASRGLAALRTVIAQDDEGGACDA